MIDMRLHGDHHALLQWTRIVAGDHRLLLMPPGTDAVPSKHRLVPHALVGEALHDEAINFSRGPARHQLLISGAIDVADHAVFSALVIGRLSDDGAARLVTGITLYVSNVVGADGIARRKGKVAFTAIGDGVARGIEDAV